MSASSAAGDAPKTNVTSTDRGLLAAPLAVIVICPLYVPSSRSEMMTDTVTPPMSSSELEVPESGARSSHLFLASTVTSTVHLRTPPPGFQIVSV